MLDGIKINERVAARGATFKALDRKWLDLTTPIGRDILAFLSSLAEDERARVLARANGGRAAAKKRGVKFGSKPKLAAHQAREAARKVREEGKSLREVALSRRPIDHCASPGVRGGLNALFGTERRRY